MEKILPKHRTRFMMQIKHCSLDVCCVAITEATKSLTLLNPLFLAGTIGMKHGREAVATEISRNIEMNVSFAPNYNSLSTLRCHSWPDCVLRIVSYGTHSQL